MATVADATQRGKAAGDDLGRQIEWVAVFAQTADHAGLAQESLEGTYLIRVHAVLVQQQYDIVAVPVKQHVDDIEQHAPIDTVGVNREPGINDAR